MYKMLGQLPSWGMWNVLFSWPRGFKALYNLQNALPLIYVGGYHAKVQFSSVANLMFICVCQWGKMWHIPKWRDSDPTVMKCISVKHHHDYTAEHSRVQKHLYFFEYPTEIYFLSKFAWPVSVCPDQGWGQITGNQAQTFIVFIYFLGIKKKKKISVHQPCALKWMWLEPSPGVMYVHGTSSLEA